MAVFWRGYRAIDSSASIGPLQSFTRLPCSQDSVGQFQNRASCWGDAEACFGRQRLEPFTKKGPWTAWHTWKPNPSAPR
jgi:hypothetical protein